MNRYPLSRFLSPKYFLSVLVAVAVFLSPPARGETLEEHFPGLYDGCAAHVLGRVTRAEKQHWSAHYVTVRYEVKVIHEVGGRLKSGALNNGDSIAVEVPLPLIGSNPVGDGEWKPDDVVLFAATVEPGGSATSGVLRYAGGYLPFDRPGGAIAEEDLPSVQAAIRELEAVAELDAGREVFCRKARELMNSRDYCVWSLGAGLVRVYRDKEGMAMLREVCLDSRTPPRKHNWAIMCLRPSDHEQYELNRRYLRLRYGDGPLPKTATSSPKDD